MPFLILALALNSHSVSFPAAACARPLEQGAACAKAVAKRVSKVACSSQCLSCISMATWFLPVVSCKIQAAYDGGVFFLFFQGQLCSSYWNMRRKLGSFPLRHCSHIQTCHQKRADRPTNGKSQALVSRICCVDSIRHTHTHTNTLGGRVGLKKSKRKTPPPPPPSPFPGFLPSLLPKAWAWLRVH